MPTSKKPRNKPRRTPPKSLKANSTTLIKAAIMPNRSRLWFQNAILGMVAAVEQDLTTLKDLDKLYHYALTNEALCEAGYAATDKALYVSWDEALDAAYRRGDNGLRYGFNPSEKEAVKAMLFEFIRVLKLTPEPDFFEIDRMMALKHNKQIEETRKLLNVSNLHERTKSA